MPLRARATAPAEQDRARGGSLPHARADSPPRRRLRVLERTLRGIRPHELLGAEGGKKIRDLILQRVWSELLDGAFGEHIAGDCRRLDDGALLAGERVEAGREQRLDRRRDREVAEPIW